MDSFRCYFIDLNKTNIQHTSKPPSEGRTYAGSSEFVDLTAAGGLLTTLRAAMAVALSYSTFTYKILILLQNGL